MPLTDKWMENYRLAAFGDGSSQDALGRRLEHRPHRRKNVSIHSIRFREDVFDPRLHGDVGSVRTLADGAPMRQYRLSPDHAPRRGDRQHRQCARQD
jgi:hypothetical protein